MKIKKEISLLNITLALLTVGSLTAIGTTWANITPNSILTIQTRPYNATGALNSITIPNNNKTAVIGMFPVHGNITVNQISILPANVSAKYGKLHICIYRQRDRVKVIDITTATPQSNTLLTTFLNTPVTLTPQSYYIAVVSKDASSGETFSVKGFTTTPVAFENGATVPTNERVYEGTATMDNANACKITAAFIFSAPSNNKTVNARLDN
jgi:hypothetical protein